jgi:cholesterol transport system auxiliary component
MTLRALCFVAALLAVAGCGGFRSTVAEPVTYMLRPVASGAQQRVFDVSLQVLAPAARPGLESARIALVSADRRMSSFAASRWPDVLPRVVESLAVESLRATGAFTAVHDGESPFGSEYLLRISVRNFEAQYLSESAAPEALVALDCMLARRSDRSVVAAFAAEGRSMAQANRMSSVVPAFEQAAQGALLQMRDRVLEAVAAESAQQ